ncbi:hypothetical protein [Ruminococcus sp. NK3A76]|uniref:hypothetical protein n=1 Tax=Ruminococcus sp. NK3A76 TaxID=877411 RepID=UPI00048BD80E|nr:hypothetical protein [Ruminococcus sp. NK3A76]
MARNLSNNMKRAVAGVCAVLVISGAAPVQPIVDFVKDSTILAKAKDEPSANDFNFSPPVDLSYSNENKVATVTSNKEGMGVIYVKYYSDASCTSEVTDRKNVGTYYVGITVSEGGNYLETTNVLHNEDWQFTIEQATTSGVTVAAKDVTYTPDTEQDLVTVTNTYGATVHYRVGNGTWGTTIPQAINAGDYTVQWYSDETTNYAASGSQTNPNTVENVKIKQAPDTFTNAPEFAVGLTPEGTAQPLVFDSPATEHGHFEYSMDWDGTDGTWDTAVPTGTAAGNYTFWYRANGDNENGVDNYGPSDPVQATVSISAPITNSAITDFNNGSSDILKLTSNLNGTVVITRNKTGIIDLNGYTISTLHLRNKGGDNAKITVINGTVGTIDDIGGKSGGYTGTIVLGNVRVTGAAYICDRHLYQAGNTSIQKPVCEQAAGYSNGVNHPAGSYGCNAIFDPVAKTDMVYTGQSQLLIEPNTINGLFGCTIDSSYFTYWYTRTAQNANDYVAGSTSSGVVNASCAPLYATDAGTYTLYYMWDSDSSYIDTTVHGSRTINIKAKLDLADDQSATYASGDKVTKAITKIEYDADGNDTIADTDAETFTYNDTKNEKPAPATALYYLQGKTIKIYSNAKLVFTVTKSGNVAGTSSDLTGFTQTFDNKGYVYTFKIPTGVNVVTAKRVYDYTLAVDGNKLVGHDKNTRPVQNDYTVATLVANDREYLVPLTGNATASEDTNKYNVRVDVDAAYELANRSTIKYYAPDEEGFEKETTPVNVGTYTARAAVSTSAQEASYELTKSFNITPRNYAKHQTNADDKITAAITNFGGDNIVTYDGNKQTPQVTITDTKISGSDKTLKRGTDYELYKKNTDDTYTLVTAANDAKYLGQTNAGTYNVYVKFIGNYMNTGDAYVPVEWTIEKATLPVLTISASDSTFNYQPHPVTAAPTNEAETLPSGGVIKYEYKVKDAADTTYSTTAPTNAGAYTARITVQNSNYKFAENQTTTKDFTIAAKNIDTLLTADSVKVTVTNGRPVVSFKFTDPQKSSTSAYQKVTLVEGTDFTTAYSQVAGQENTYQFAVAPKAGSNYTFTADTANTKKTFTTETALTTATVTLASNDDIVYDGTAKKPDVVVKFGDTVLTKDTDYTVSYSNNINAGTATVTVSDGTSAAFVTGSTTFTIQPKSIADVTITVDDETLAADGTAKTPAITVKDGETTLTKDKDYTVSYSNNVNAGCDTGVITLKGKGNYTGTNANGTFSIKSTLDIEAVKSMITKIEYDADGNGEFVTGETIAPTTFENTYNFIPTKKIRITSNGKLSFTDGHTVVAAENQTSSGYVYTLSIDNNTNKVTATHVYDYTNLVGTTDGQSVTITGIDTNIINNTTPTNLASVTIGDVYFLDDISTKITTQAVNAPGTTVSYGTITYTALPLTGAALNNRLPYSAGKYKAALTVTLTDDSGTETFRITDLQFEVKPRVYNNNTSEIGIAVTYGDSTTTTPFVQDYTNNTVFVPTITITDSKIGATNNILKRGTDYDLCKANGDVVAAAGDKDAFGQSAANNYSNIYVKFKGNYVNDATDVTALKPVSWTIEAKATPTVTPPLGLTLTDNHTPQVLISAGSTTGGTLYYALGTDSTTAPTGGWTDKATDIKGQAADTYYVWYKVVGNDRVKDVAPACVTAKINEYVPEKKDQTWTVTVDNYVYDGTAHNPKINGTLYGDRTDRYINTDTNEVLAEAPTEIGNYELEVTAAGTSTYNPRTWSTTYSILEKADYSVTGARFHTANTVSFKEKVEFNFLVETKDVYTAEGAYVVFTYNHYGKDVTVTKQINKADKNGKYYRVRLPLTASEMATEITAELYLANSETPVDIKTRSIKDYAEAAIEAGLDGSDVLKAMLNYGGYTQTALGNNIDLLANSGEGIAVDVSGVAPKSATTFVRPTAAEGAKVTYKGSTTMTTSDLYVRHYFTVDPSLTASELNAVKVKVGENDPVSMSKLKKNSIGYYCEASPELAYELDRENGSIVVYGFEGAETADSPNAIRIENYNVIDYCEAVANSSTHTVEAKNMVKALYSYYTAAKAYVESRV